MSAAAGLSIDEIELGTAIDLYNCRTIDGLISSGHLLLQSLSPADLNLKESDEEITNSHRQWLQSIEARGELKNGYFIRTEIESTIASLPLPINFLDFETARPVLPFNANKRPYEQLLFQYSLHRLESGLDFRHIAQYLAEPGTEPTLPTLRDLQASLGKNTGPVLHWWDHERTVLNEIRKNLTEAGNRVPDGADLVEFIDSLVGSTKAPGRLYDLGKLVHRCAYYSGTRGRSSLKQVLPAILRTSNAMREKYSRAIYGSEAGLRSSNFENQAWVSANTPDRFDPYILLGDIGPHEALQNVEKFEDDEDFVADGGAAMAAFAMLQNGLLGEAEALQTKKQLLKYCELDTFAMCLAWEHLCEIATL